MDRKPGLAWITLNNVNASEFIAIAAQLHCGSVALLGRAPMPGFGSPVRPDEIDKIRSMLTDNGMILSSLDILPIGPDFDPGAYDALLELGATLGAQRIGAGVFDPDRGRVADKLRMFAARARAYDLRVGVEFVSFSALRTLADAVALINQVGDPYVSITFDILHFVRTGGEITQLDAATVAKIGYVQICDGPKTMAQDRLMWEAGSQRMIPGEGTFDLAGIFARLPPHLIVDAETPMQDLAEQGIPPLEQARRIVTATTTLLNLVHAARSG